MTARRVLVAVLVPLIVLLESLAWYGLQTARVMYMMDVQGASIVNLGTVLLAFNGVRVVGLVASGVAAALIGPFVTATVGLVVFALAMAALAFAPAGEPMIAWALIGAATFANGFTVPPLWGGLAATFARPYQAARDAAFFVTYATLQVGAALASLLFAFTLDGPLTSGGFPVLFGACAAVAVVSALLTAGLAGSHLALAPVEDDAPSERWDGRIAGLAAVVGVLSLLPWVGYGITSDHVWSASWTAGTAPTWATQAINPVLVLAVAGVSAALSGLAAWFRLDPPVLLVAGGAFLVTAIGGALAAGASQITAWGYLFGLVVLSGTEGLMLPLLLSRILGDMHWRLSALYAGLWLGASSGLWLVASSATAAVGGAYGQVPVMFAGAALCALGGLVLLAVAIPHQRLVRMVLDPPEPEMAPE